MPAQLRAATDVCVAKFDETASHEEKWGFAKAALVFAQLAEGIARDNSRKSRVYAQLNEALYLVVDPHVRRELEILLADYVSDESRRARRYRSYAEELRVIAVDGAVSTAQQSLLEIAIQYDQMAASVEAMHRCNIERTAPTKPDVG